MNKTLINKLLSGETLSGETLSRNTFSKGDLLKSTLKASLILGGVFMAADALAMDDGSIKTAWESSKLEAIISKDLKRISAIVATGICSIMAVIPSTQKINLIGGTFAGIVGGGFLLDWVKGTYTALI